MTKDKTSSAEIAGHLLAKFLAEKGYPTSTAMLGKAIAYYRIELKVTDGPPRTSITIFVAEDGAVWLDLVYDGFPESARPQLKLNIYEPGSLEAVSKRIQLIMGCHQ